MLELSDLKTFAAVVQAGGINKAAESLHRAQSSITVRIQQLEEKLGVTLFHRDGRKLQLSPAGKVLMDYAERLLDLADEAAEATRNDRPSGTLRLGAMESTAAVRLPQPLGLFHEMYPDVALELSSGDPAELAERVIDGTLDAALTTDPGGGQAPACDADLRGGTGHRRQCRPSPRSRRRRTFPPRRSWPFRAAVRIAAAWRTGLRARAPRRGASSRSAPTI
ncbi:hypothetical protein OJJOAM_004639 [Cupriavidus sp. H18C1]|uniref:LysR family transcriptional regulator n=1 Tax=Cupriavidus sp. H18C1 TaxID=3241601 RepID=UPI003BB8552C